jgi:DNA-binding IclR family transcriptional regulator
VAVPSGNSYQVRALERALDILGLFSLREAELTLSDMSDRTGVAKSTTFRLVSVLTEYGYLERLPDAERYRIGVRAFELGSIYIQSTTIEAEARPFMEALARECQQTANLGVLSRGEVVHIAVIPADRAIRFYASVGEREKAYCTGLGKALISEFSDEDLADLVALHPFVQRTRRTITSLDVLRINLAEIRRLGYALDDEESNPGLRCVAATIRNDKSDIVAAVSVSGPAFEFSEDALPSIAESVTRAARDISTRLGYAIQTTAQPKAAELNATVTGNGDGA